MLVVVVILATVAVGLSVPCRYSLGKLRLLELIVFGLPILFLAIVEYAIMRQAAREGDLPMTLATMKSTVLYFFGM